MVIDFPLDIGGADYRFAESKGILNGQQDMQITNASAGRTSLDLATPPVELFHFLPHGLCLFDADHRLQLCNRQFQLLCGIDPDRIKIGMHLSDLLDGIQRDDLGKTISTSIAIHSGFADRNNLWIADDGKVVSFACEYLPEGGYAVLNELVQNLDQRSGRGGYDPLTGLANREMFNAEIEQQVEKANETFEEVALLFLDLDRFKPVNDNLGHPVGDAVLNVIADRLSEQLKEHDLVARLGGDEFGIIQTGVPQPIGARSLAKRIIESIAEPIKVLGHTVNLGISVGVAIAPMDAESAPDLLRKADLAMYRAKKDGRNLLRFFEPQMEAQIAERQAKEIALGQALENKQFSLRYQPSVDLKTDQIRSVEALIRWEHPQLGVILPSEFVALAEQTGEINSIGAWVLETACQAATQWPEDVSIAVNVSPLQLTERSFVDNVSRVLGETGLTASRLELEITENALLEETKLTYAVLTELRALGVRIAMDDFGTGYSSINHLRRVRFDKIKIDRSFVSGLTPESEEAALVSMIASLGKCLSTTTTAEGVETESELEMVRNAGCDQYQGFYMSKPVIHDELMAIFSVQNQ